MMVLAACAVLAGCMLLALSQAHRRKAVEGGAASDRLLMVVRIAAWGLLGMALGLCQWGEGPGFGVLIWTLLCALASFLVAMTLAFSPQWLRAVARACLFLRW